MALYAKDTGGGNGDYEPVREGMHHGICAWIYDLGTQYQSKFDSYAHKIVIVWELPEVRMEIEKDGEKLDLPKVVSKMYTLSLHSKSNLRKDLETWAGKSMNAQDLKGFDLKKLLSVNCTLQILHNQNGEKTYANISSITPKMQNMKVKTPEGGTRFFSFEEGREIPENTPDWIVDKIKESKEWQQTEDSSSGWESGDQGPTDDDIPF